MIERNKVHTLLTKMKTKVPSVFLMSSVFFLPFGFDAIFATIMHYTNSFWITDAIMYSLSGFFFGLYLLSHKYLISNGKEKSI